MDQNHSSSFLLSLVSSLSRLEKCDEVIIGLVEGLRSLLDGVDVEGCGCESVVCKDAVLSEKGEKRLDILQEYPSVGLKNEDYLFFELFNGKGLYLSPASSLSDDDLQLIKQTIDIVSSFLQKLEKVDDDSEITILSSCDDLSEAYHIQQLEDEIKKRLLYEKKLRESEERYRLILDNSLDAILLATPGGEILSVNKAACSIFCMTEQEILNAGRDKLVDLDDPRLYKITEERERAGKVNGELFLFRKGGRRFEAEISSASFLNRKGEPRISLVIRDITHAKKAESQLMMLSHAIEQSPLSIIITDRSGVMKYVNRAFTTTTGYAETDVIGKTPRIFKSGKQRRTFYTNLWDTILLGHEWNGELINKKKDGSLYWEYVTISPVKNAEGEIIYFVAIREDISEKKKMIDDLVRAKEKAEESDRLKTAFLANISHEIRTPMNGILGFLELLKNPTLGDEEKNNFIEVVNKSGDRLLRTINDIIEISKIESGQVRADYSSVDIRDVMEYYLKFFEPSAKEKQLGLKIGRQIPSHKSLIRTDRSKIDAALSNLISNAIKFTSSGYVEFGNFMDEGTLVFYVKDTGIGIPPDQMNAVFDRFIQADLNMTKPYQGTGLGLSIIRGYIHLLNGEIWVESEEGKGSIFYFSIPYFLV